MAKQHQHQGPLPPKSNGMLNPQEFSISKTHMRNRADAAVIEAVGSHIDVVTADNVCISGVLHSFKCGAEDGEYDLMVQYPVYDLNDAYEPLNDYEKSNMPLQPEFLKIDHDKIMKWRCQTKNKLKQEPIELKKEFSKKEKVKKDEVKKDIKKAANGDHQQQPQTAKKTAAEEPHTIKKIEKFPELPSSAPNFKTDPSISSVSTKLGERELQPWKPEDDDSGVTLEESFTSSTGAWNQFKANKIESSYNENLYTTEIDKSKPDFAKREQEAARIAREMEKNGRPKLSDLGVDEEDKYASVVRDSDSNKLFEMIKPKDSNATASTSSVASSKSTTPILSKTQSAEKPKTSGRSWSDIASTPPPIAAPSASKAEKPVEKPKVPASSTPVSASVTPSETSRSATEPSTIIPTSKTEQPKTEQPKLSTKSCTPATSPSVNAGSKESTKNVAALAKPAQTKPVAKPTPKFDFNAASTFIPDNVKKTNSPQPMHPQLQQQQQQPLLQQHHQPQQHHQMQQLPHHSPHQTHQQPHHGIPKQYTPRQHGYTQNFQPAYGSHRSNFGYPSSSPYQHYPTQPYPPMGYAMPQMMPPVPQIQRPNSFFDHAPPVQGAAASGSDKSKKKKVLLNKFDILASAKREYEAQQKSDNKKDPLPHGLVPLENPFLVGPWNVAPQLEFSKDLQKFYNVSVATPQMVHMAPISVPTQPVSF